MNGWIKLHRKLLNSNMYEQLTSKQRDVLIQCLLLANHAPKDWMWEGEIFTCEAGQFITSLDSLERHCSKDVSKQNIRTALVVLEKWQFLTNKSTKTGRLISITNWHTYQQLEDDTNTPTNKALTKHQQSSNKALTPNNNIKNVKKVNNDKNINTNIKKKFGEFENVLLTQIEESKLIEKFNGTFNERVDRLSEYIESTGKKYKSHYATLLAWSRREEIQTTNKYSTINQSNYKKGLNDDGTF